MMPNLVEFPEIDSNQKLIKICFSNLFPNNYDHMHTFKVAASTKYTKGTYNPAMPNTFEMPMSINTGSFNKLTSNIVLMADLNDSGSTKHGHKSYSVERER